MEQRGVRRHGGKGGGLVESLRGPSQVDDDWVTGQLSADLQILLIFQGRTKARFLPYTVHFANQRRCGDQFCRYEVLMLLNRRPNLW